MNNTLSAHDVQQYLKEIFPQFNASILDISDKGAVVELPTDEQHLRPGGTVSGPTMMGLADAAMYVAILGKLGKVALAVTTNLNINFLRKPAERDLIADARLIKLGRRLAVGDVSVHPEGDEEMCAHVTATYSIPPRD